MRGSKTADFPLDSPLLVAILNCKGTNMIAQILGWIANACLLWSWYRLGGPPQARRRALAWGVVGSLLWALTGLLAAMWPLVTIELLLAGLGCRAYFQWET